MHNYVSPAAKQLLCFSEKQTLAAIQGQVEDGILCISEKKKKK